MKAIDSVSCVSGHQYDSALSLGARHYQAREYEQALQYFSEAKTLQPYSGAAWAGCGDVFAARSEFSTASAFYEQALKLDTHNAEIHLKLGSVYAELAMIGTASVHLIRSLELNPRQSRCWAVLVQIHSEGASSKETVRKIQSMVSGNVDRWIMLSGIGRGLLMLGRYADARELLALSLRNVPENTESLLHLAEVEMCLGNMDQSRQLYERAVAQAPNSYLTFICYLEHLIRTSDIDEAKSAYRRRLHSSAGFRKEPLAKERVSYPEWSGQAPSGKTILFRNDGGHGGTLQYVRFARQMREQGATIVVECRRPLLRLLSTLDGAESIVEKQDDYPQIDYCARPGMAALLLDWSWATLGAHIPYVHPPGDLISRWDQRLGNHNSLRVGLNWYGEQLWRRDENRYRSIPLREFGTMAMTPGVRLYSLQFGVGAEQTASAGFEIEHLKVGDLLDTGAAIAALDVVVTIDTVVAHLAGALGKPCFLLLPYIACWRWMLGRTDSPFYPSMRLFRQTKGGNWSGPIAAACRELAVLAQTHCLIRQQSEPGINQPI